MGDSRLAFRIQALLRPRWRHSRAKMLNSWPRTRRWRPKTRRCKPKSTHSNRTRRLRTRRTRRTRRQQQQLLLLLLLLHTEVLKDRLSDRLSDRDSELRRITLNPKNVKQKGRRRVQTTAKTRKAHRRG